jgi:cysteine-rich repeat protein
MITRNAAALLFSCIALAGCTFDGTGFGEQPPTTQAGTETTSTTTSTTTSDVTTEPTTTTMPGDLCGNYQQDDGEECDQGPNGNGVCTPSCAYNVCGDNYVGAGEDCEGVVEGCVNCQLASCGNGMTDAGEECDDGNADETDACLSTCKNAGCGDSFTHVGVEQCDDGNDLDTDACVDGCKMAVCGDGLVWDGNEHCDDGNQVDDDDCPNSCGPPGCGDGIKSPGEECDDGNQTNDDGCSNACKNPECGDSIVQSGEECDNGVTQNADDAACTLECKNNVCGDGKPHMGVEQCDDGNPVDDDDCTNACKNPVCGDNIVQDGEDCDDANDVQTDGCLDTCKSNTCGDGFVHMGVEDCDDGNDDQTDDCLDNCELASCGDGWLHADSPEECDHGAHNNNDVTKATCKTDCTRSGFLVFVSSQLYIPGTNFDSIAAADARCADLAASDMGWLKIKGHKWKAWLGDGAVGPGNNFHKSSIPYYTLRNTTTAKIAESWTDLVDADIITGIDVTDTNQELTGGSDCDGNHVVWTGIKADNSFGTHCSKWASGDMEMSALAGSVKKDDAAWTEGCGNVDCNLSARIYCFEQPS